MIDKNVKFIFFISIFTSALLMFSILSVEASEINVEKGVAAKGYDVVTYFNGTPRKGKSKYKSEHRGVTYYFVDNNNLHKFISNPDKYLPEYGGWCAYAMLDGKKVDVNPERFKIIQGKLYLFYDGFFGDTLERWNNKLTSEPENILVDRADKHWTNLSENM